MEKKTQISGRKKRIEEEGAPCTFPLLPHLPAACQAQPLSLPSPSATSLADHLFLPLYLHHRHCSTRAPFPFSSLICRRHFYYCPISPPSSVATSTAGSAASATTPSSPAPATGQNHLSRSLLPPTIIPHALCVVFPFSSLIYRWHFCCCPISPPSSAVASAAAPSPLLLSPASAASAAAPSHSTSTASAATTAGRSSH
ncbi:hypothetical protein B296_00010296 [Ensete ventricosum]|uniref:Uncharacterized protein n=1 Tax=Ensete ventricosum TaxID=4639 RepID=A0A426XYD5_ENSVE|nr:hypothetical protein B296_00010296 [Ensete ventricosum]